jgi:hypothetical protein
MNIVILQGEAVINNVRSREKCDLVVQVRDGNRRPLAGAAVVFTLPEQGPGGEFADGSRTLTATADGEGLATAKEMAPNKAAGKFEIQVEASHAGETARATITQFNMEVRSEQGGRGKWAALFVILGAAAAGGAVAATRSSHRPPGSAAAPLPPITITPGSGTVGPPR